MILRGWGEPLLFVSFFISAVWPQIQHSSHFMTGEQRRELQETRKYQRNHKDRRIQKEKRNLIKLFMKSWS
jgi:hypothetical protein